MHYQGFPIVMYGETKSAISQCYRCTLKTILVSRAMRIFHVLIIERASLKWGKGRKNTYGESRHLFVYVNAVVIFPFPHFSRARSIINT